MNFYTRALAANGDYGTLALDEALTKELLEILRRDWAVRVLDSWRNQDRQLRDWTMHSADNLKLGSALCWMYQREVRIGVMGQNYGGADDDAAREAAAIAVFPTLPESERQRIGERP